MFYLSVPTTRFPALRDTLWRRHTKIFKQATKKDFKKVDTPR